LALAALALVAFGAYDSYPMRSVILCFGISESSGAGDIGGRSAARRMLGAAAAGAAPGANSQSAAPTTSRPALPEQYSRSVRLQHPATTFQKYRQNPFRKLLSLS